MARKYRKYDYVDERRLPGGYLVSYETKGLQSRRVRVNLEALYYKPRGIIASVVVWDESKDLKEFLGRDIGKWYRVTDEEMMCMTNRYGSPSLKIDDIREWVLDFFLRAIDQWNEKQKKANIGNWKRHQERLAEARKRMKERKDEDGEQE